MPEICSNMGTWALKNSEVSTCPQDNKRINITPSWGLSSTLSDYSHGTMLLRLMAEKKAWYVAVNWLTMIIKPTVKRRIGHFVPGNLIDSETSNSVF